LSICQARDRRSRRPSGCESIGFQFRSAASSNDRQLPAHSSERILEELGFVRVSLVLWPGRPAPAHLSHPRARLPPIQLDVLVPSAAHSGVQGDELVLVEIE
jgi:hypothetical protein